MQLTDLVIIGIAIMLSLAIVVIALVMLQQRQVIRHKLVIQDKDLQLQRERLQAILEGQEQERKRIAEDLHDEVGAQLSALKLTIGGLQPLLKTGNGEKERLKETKDFTDTIIQQLRYISQSLHPQALENLGLAHALDSFCSLINKNKQVKINFVGPEDTYPVDQSKALHAYRVVQELINNIIKHAQATEVTVFYSNTPARLTIEVADNGNEKLLHTLDTAKQKINSLGLKNIESRLNIIGGAISFNKWEPKGTLARIQVEDYQAIEQK
ncbi:sensor histidine kinase [Chitinophaga sp. Cy-1792]|uniref:sensor histidine kinase n=1 Tax=Chitinophaga sp. Cy-1792 TaxID=2608339 RepID=UPI00142326A8|nr:sensor histidine kinase [Chitinophaga sp. Cy-1792]NIG56110.1 sensor histidine kinase [Chitinophaga sp. Cy-1792]